ncbi:uncharacterized protein KRP23_1728 [Phytophthora ramorum]|uniref:uncharacterized protein n=1 Tax=Phytophthora ramorum TaxID=164328 RepID=UPI0030B79E4A|nr:hypothetical protein KRP23_1728 [Phytophthora ramorum]
MVRLTARSYLHLTPEVVDGNVDQPFYAKVLRLEPIWVTLLSLEGGEGRVLRSVAETHVTTASDVNKAGRVSLLRRAVSVTSADQVHYGQVIAVDGDTVTVASDGHQFGVRASSVEVVAPVIALLLEHVQFNSDEWSPSDIKAIEESILKQVLGEDGDVGSNNIATVLGDLLEDDNLPSATKTCHWVDPKSGNVATFTLQHALDFAYYVDGGVDPVPASVGESFCRPPEQQRTHHPDKAGGSIGETGGLFDPFTDDDETPQDQSERESVGQTSVSGQQNRGKRPHQAVSISTDPSKYRQKRIRNAVDQDDLIIEKLRGNPDLMHRFLSMRQNIGALPNTTIKNAVTIAQPEQLITGSTSKKAAPTSKFDFAPREDQQCVHERVTAVKHKEFAPADPATNIEEVADASRVFLSYVREYCCVELIELVKCMVEFIEETLAQVPWSIKDLSALVYWVNDVLEDFRAAAEAGET